MTQAMVLDPHIYRALIKGFYGLASATDWMKDPAIWLRIARAAFPNAAKRRIVAPFWVRPSRDDIRRFIETPAAPA